MNENRYPEAGSKIGHYCIQKEIARGSMGIIFLGIHENLHIKVAIKMLPHSFIQDEKYVQRFYNEAEAAAKLKHQNIATVHDILKEFGTYFYIMDYIEGLTLEKEIEQAGLSQKQAIECMKQVLSGIMYAHKQGVIHRDLKPANIIITEDNQAVITDFGLAKIEDSTVITVDGTILGTPAYMSPEQIKAEEIDCRTDIYSAGVIFYETLTERSPFHTAHHMATMKKVLDNTPVSPRRINKNIAKDLETVVLKAMEKDPDRRYQNAESFFDDINRFTMGEIILAKPPNLFYKINKHLIKQKKIVIPIILLLCAFLSFQALQNYRYQKNRSASKKILKQAENQISKIQQEKRILLDQLSEDPLFRVLQDKDPFIRANALNAIHKKIRGKEIVGSLAKKTLDITLKSLHDPNTTVRRNAAILTGLLKDSRLAHPLMQQLQVETDEETIINIVLALGWLETKSALNVLHMKLKQSNPIIKENVLLALGMISSEESIDAVVECLKSPHEKVRANACLALAEINNPITIPYVLPLLKDDSNLVLQSAEKSIQMFGEAARFPVMQYILSDPEAKEDNIIQVIQSINNDTDEDLLPLLYIQLNHKSEKIRSFAVMSIGLFSKYESIPILIDMLDDPSSEVTDNAHLSLIGITQENLKKEKTIWMNWYNKNKNNQ